MYEFEIRDMSCGHCVSTVEKAIKAVDPSAKSTIDLISRTAKVETLADPALLSAAIEDAGYPTSFKAI